MMRFSRLPRLVTATLGIFFALATLAPLPFAIVLPGEAQNIFKGVITFKGLTNYPPSGRIDLMSIRVTNPDAWILGPELVYSWISGNRAVYPKSAIYPPGTSSEEESKQAKADMVKSQDTAIIAAVNYLQSHPEIMADTNPIGGINEKITSARKVGATVFFAPVDNADEISNVPEGIKVVTVATLAQAINYLERSGR